MLTKCSLCGGEAVQKFTLAHTSVWDCQTNRCGLRFASPQLDEEELARAYSTYYYPSAGDGRSSPYEETSPTLARQLFSQLQETIGNLKGLRMLDYGCGRGPVSATAQEFGLVSTGVDPDPVARSAAAGQLKIAIYANLHELRSKVGSPQFDVILLWQVIEHLRLPWKELEALRVLLSPRGKLLIGTMNVDCLRSRIERPRWTNYLNPTHFYYFDRCSLERMLTFSGFSQVTQWKPKFRYPQHGVIRRCAYEAASVFGVADGLYYLCSA